MALTQTDRAEQFSALHEAQEAFVIAMYGTVAQHG
jgi:hypothetical protein